MKRLLLCGCDKILEIGLNDKNISELISAISETNYSWDFIDISTNIMYASTFSCNDYIEYNLNDINLINDEEFRSSLLMILTPLIDYALCNYSECDLNDYFLSIASNEKICRVIFESVLIEAFVACKVVIERLLHAISKVNPLLHKRLYMELQLRDIEWWG